MKFICFPWSGGTANIYFKFSNDLDPLEICPIDPRIENDSGFEEVINQCAGYALEEIENDEKVILFGHSMGAVLAYETALLLRKKGYRGKIGLLISGMTKPSIDQFELLNADLNSGIIMNYMKELGMDNMDKLPGAFIDMLADKMSIDINLLKKYHTVSEDKLDAEVIIIYSEQERASNLELLWEGCFEKDVTYEYTSGSHFYLLKDFSPVSRNAKKLARMIS